MAVPVWDQVVLDVWISAIAGQMLDEVIAGAMVILQTESIVGDKVDATTTWPTVEVSKSINLVTWTSLMHVITHCETITISEFPDMASNESRNNAM